MQLGIFAKTFFRPTLAETLDAVVAHGFGCIQFNFACAGLPSMPERISAELAAEIRSELKKRNLSMAGVSGTFNMIHPDMEKRRDGFRRLNEMAASCSKLGASVISLCTGTRDRENMWKHHPDNDSSEAWHELVTSMSLALETSEKYEVVFGIEPEISNVVSSAGKARRLLDEIKSPRLKIILDAANLFHPGELKRQREILDEAFNLLGNEIIMAHAKDVHEINGEIEHVAAGNGTLDYDFYVSKLNEAKFSGPFVLHGLEETEVSSSVEFLQGKCSSQRESALTAQMRVDQSRLTSAATEREGLR